MNALQSELENNSHNEKGKGRKSPREGKSKSKVNSMNIYPKCWEEVITYT